MERLRLPDRQNEHTIADQAQQEDDNVQYHGRGEVGHAETAQGGHCSSTVVIIMVIVHLR